MREGRKEEKSQAAASGFKGHKKNARNYLKTDLLYNRKGNQ